MSQGRRQLLIVDDDVAHRAMLSQLLADLGIETRGAGNGVEALASIEQQEPDLVLLDMRMPVLDGLGTLAEMRDRGVAVPTIVLTAHADLDEAVRAMKLGALDYLRKPIDIASLQSLLATYLPEPGTPNDELPELPDDLVAESPLMQDVLRDLARVAGRDVSLLLRGETGTGKDVLARLIHRWSARCSGPMVAVNVAALPEALVESELFGHCRGAFTGADEARAGRIEQAHGGTLFMDEIGEMPASIQPKILRALQDGRITRLGEVEERQVDFRLVSATNRNLDEAVADGSFREDLYYRIAVITIEVPPLREREEDVLPLARRFVAAGAGARKRLAPATETLLLAHDWPGNVRELRSAMLRAAILAPGDVILPENLPPRIRTIDRAPAAPEPTVGLSLAELERRAIEGALERSEGNRTEAARALGISRRKLLYRLKQYQEDDQGA